MPEAKCTEKEAREMSQLLNSGITDIAVCAIIAALCIAITVSEVRKKNKSKKKRHLCVWMRLLQRLHVMQLRRTGIRLFTES